MILGRCSLTIHFLVMASSSEDEDELYQELSEELYGVLSESDAAAVLAAVRGTRAARSKVDGAGTGQPLRAHRFLLTGGARCPTTSWASCSRLSV